jgi:hypothetical protein
LCEEKPTVIAIAILLQAAGPPDIELNIRAKARSVVIEQRGEAKIEVSGDAGSRADVRVEPRPSGQRTLRDVTVNIHARASVGEPSKIESKAETGTPR